MFKRFIAALSFLTVLPFPAKMLAGKDDLKESTTFFPVVGLLIGGLLALLAFGLGRIFPHLPTAMILVIAMLSVSGGLHLDGLSDTADGFLSSRSRERILEIMKDSHVGAMGVLAIVGLIGLKFSALASIPLKDLPFAVVLMPVAGRCAILVMSALLPYARPEGGLGSLFAIAHPRMILSWAVLFLFLAGGFLLKGPGLIASGGTILLVLLFAAYCRKMIGGMTGDTLGASCEIAEGATALILSIFLR